MCAQENRTGSMRRGACPWCFSTSMHHIDQSGFAIVGTPRIRYRCSKCTGRVVICMKCESAMAASPPGLSPDKRLCTRCELVEKHVRSPKKRMRKHIHKHIHSCGLALVMGLVRCISAAIEVCGLCVKVKRDTFFFRMTMCESEARYLFFLV